MKIYRLSIDNETFKTIGPLYFTNEKICKDVAKQINHLLRHFVYSSSIITENQKKRFLDAKMAWKIEIYNTIEDGYMDDHYGSSPILRFASLVVDTIIDESEMDIHNN